MGVWLSVEEGWVRGLVVVRFVPHLSVREEDRRTWRTIVSSWSKSYFVTTCGRQRVQVNQVVNEWTFGLLRILTEPLARPVIR